MLHAGKKYPKVIGVPPRLAKPGRDGVVTSMLSSRWTGACPYLLYEPMYAAKFWNRGFGDNRMFILSSGMLVFRRLGQWGHSLPSKVHTNRKQKQNSFLRFKIILMFSCITQFLVLLKKLKRCYSQQI